jgi:hypothetical protein
VHTLAAPASHKKVLTKEAARSGEANPGNRSKWKGDGGKGLTFARG